MVACLLRFMFRRWTRPALLGLGLLLVTAGVILTATVSRSVVVVVEEDISRFWRTTYDILVRPPGTRNPIEEKYSLVEANFTSGLSGGISFEQYRAIREIPDVEVAAPITVLGYIPTAIDSTTQTPPAPGVYFLEGSLVVDEGHRLWEDTSGMYVYAGPIPPDVPRWKPGEPQPFPGLFYDDTARYINAHPLVYLLLAAIDPEQEAALVGLDRALLQGEYLTGQERMVVTHEDTTGWPPELRVTNPLTHVKNVPVLINATPYVHFTSTLRMSRLVLPEDARDLKTILERGGADYLKTFTEWEVLEEDTVDSQTAYRQMIENIFHPQGTISEHTLDEYRRPGPRVYRQISPPFPHPEPVLELVPPEPWQGNRNITRTVVFSLQPKGVFDITGIPRPAEVSQVPLETYFPPEAILRYDEDGRPVPPTPLRPTLIPDRYMPSPPLLLTTIEAARILAGEECIGAIRVRVRGIDQLTPEAQRKIAAVAAEIRRRTGLEVDIMVGSSPTRILVRVPGIGYVEEPWIRKGVAFAYRQRVHSGHLLLLASLFVIGGVFVLDLAWADFLARRRTVALEKAVGWRSSTVLGQMLLQALLVGLAGAILGALVAWGLIGLLGWELPDLTVLVVVPTIAVGIGLAGSAYPAWAAAQVLPDPLLRERETPLAGCLPVQAVGLARYSAHGLARRRTRTLLSLLAAALSTALLVLLLGVLVDRHSYLSGTLLGEYILVHVESYHYALLVISFVLAAISFAEHLLAGVLERQREIGVLKALGWRTGAVARLFLLEGAVLGLLGGLAGTTLGLAVYLGLYRSVGAGLLWAVLAGLGVPTLVGVLAAVYPARVAAAVAPAEAVRGE
jgi:cell division protein FtsX